jgi:hypothetical protein
LKLKNILRGVPAVNDAAERGVKMGGEYVNVLTKNPERRQDIMMTVQKHRSVKPFATKK